MQRNALAEAATLAKQMLIKCPHHPRALFTLAHICLARNVPEKGIALLERELTYVPANVTLRKMLADCYEMSGQFEHAISTANSLVNLNESFESLWHLIGLLFKYSQHHELLNACARAQKLAGEDQQKHSQVALIRGQSLRISGRRNEAIAAFKVSIETYNYNVDAWLALADMKNYQFSQTEMQQLELLISALDNDKCSKAKASFALAKAIELNRGIEKSMPFYESANRLVSGITFSESLMQAEFDARISTYTKRAIELQGDTQPMQPRPIFIVGMPCSESTLVDQILASHPLIAGTIEQPTLPYIERRAQQMCRSSCNKDLHHGLSLLDEHQLT
jgi:tetratricopeptide (TPR) repeat protein